MFEEHEGRRTEKKSLADAVVNPHQQDCGYPYKELCGAGVAWNVIRVLYENYDMDKREAEDLLDFVAMATVCDVMSLTGENRILVKEGLKRIRHTKNIGLQALMQACNVQPENISAYHFGYVLGPCVNATGRLDTARHALRLFETGQETEAEEIARDLVDLNQERKELTLQGVEMAKKLCEEGGYENDPVLVLFLPDVHESIAGLIAGRIREMYNRPVFVLTRGEEGVKGSGRSTENYSMYENMCGCAELFTKFGGHPMAAGLSLPEENVEKFRRKINENCPLTVEEVCPDIHIDMAGGMCEYGTGSSVCTFGAVWKRQSISTVCRPESVHQPHVVDRKEPECSSDECSFGIRTAGSGYFLWGCGDVVCIFYRKVWSGRGGECAAWKKKPDFIFYGVYSKD